MLVARKDYDMQNRIRASVLGRDYLYFCIFDTHFLHDIFRCFAATLNLHIPNVHIRDKDIYVDLQYNLNNLV